MATEAAKQYKEDLKAQNENQKNVPLLMEEQTMKYQGITIHKHKNCSTWYTRFRKNGQVIFISAKTQLECYNKLKKTIREFSQVKIVKEFTLGDWIKDWFKIYKEDLRPRSKLDLNYITNNIPQAMKNRKIKSFEAIDLKNYIDGIHGDRTKQRVYVVLNDIFDKAVKNNKITSNPLANISRPKYEPKERYALSLEEENKLYEKIKKDPESTILVFGLLEGLRPGELLALEYTDIDLKNKTVSVTKAIDDKTSDTQVKNKYSNRTIPLFYKAYNLVKHFDTTKKERISKLDGDELNKKLQGLAKDIIHANITLYNLRHTFISRLGNNNIPEHIIQSWCGHEKGSKVTKKTYTHINKEAEIKYINILNKE